MAEAISCIIVTYNESRYLHRCLDSLGFCDEIILCDLGSTDRTREIASTFRNVRLVTHPPVPAVEEVWPVLFPLATHPWLLRMDPDEIFPGEIVAGLRQYLSEHGECGVLSLYYQYYFRGKPLRGTRWGGRRAINKLYKDDAVILTGNIHHGVAVRKGALQHVFEGDGQYVVQHFWADSYAGLFGKHLRYIDREGESRYRRGCM